jgi:uncharacterized protein YndB with AHSA1/START domain
MSGTCEVRLTRYYTAAQDEVWALLTEPASLARWLAPSGEIELRPNGRFELLLEHGTMNGQVREVDPPRVLELDWLDGDQPSIVRFELRHDGEGTVLVLDHRRIDALVGMRETARWERRLTRLDQVIER